MGIFDKDHQSTKQKTSSTIIAEGVFIKGGIDSNGSMIISGKFEGAAVIAETLTVGRTGMIVGEVICKKLIVNGTIEGIVNAESIHILGIGKIIGKIQYESLEVDKDGIFEGEGKKKNSDFKSKYTELVSTEDDLALEE